MIKNMRKQEEEKATNVLMYAFILLISRNLSTHMRDNHPKEGEDHWPCEDCGKVFHSKRYLNKHVQNCHKGKLICPYCSKLCTKSHIITAHKEQPSVCDVCSAVFKNKHALSGHKRKVHAEKVMVTCPDCFQVIIISVECLH